MLAVGLKHILPLTTSSKIRTVRKKTILKHVPPASPGVASGKAKIPKSTNISKLQK